MNCVSYRKTGDSERLDGGIYAVRFKSTRSTPDHCHHQVDPSSVVLSTIYNNGSNRLCGAILFIKRGNYRTNHNKKSCHSNPRACGYCASIEDCRMKKLITRGYLEILI